MIGKVRGVIDSYGEDFVILDVQGVGGRVALAILSALGPDELSRAVSSGDKAMIRVLLPKADPASDDAADALAIAITHAHHRKARALVG